VQLRRSFFGTGLSNLKVLAQTGVVSGREGPTTLAPARKYLAQYGTSNKDAALYFPLSLQMSIDGEAGGHVIEMLTPP
jgi:hypothetical protein